jgi:hypothetical protein
MSTYVLPKFSSLDLGILFTQYCSRHVSFLCFAYLVDTRTHEGKKTNSTLSFSFSYPLPSPPLPPGLKGTSKPRMTIRPRPRSTKRGTPLQGISPTFLISRLRCRFICRWCLYRLKQYFLTSLLSSTDTFLKISARASSG